MSVYCIVNQVMQLADPTKKIRLNEPLAYSNSRAHAFRVTVVDEDGGLVDLTGVSCVGNFMSLSRDETVAPIIGTVDTATGVAEIILPESCYLKIGRFRFTMELGYTDGDNNEEVRTALWVEGTVERNVDGTIIDPGTPVGNIEQAISQCVNAANAATEAAEDAEEAAAAANNSVSYNAQTGKTDAQKATARENVDAASYTAMMKALDKVQVEMIRTDNLPVGVIAGGINTSGGNTESTTRCRTQFFKVLPNNTYALVLGDSEFVNINVWEYTGTTVGSVIDSLHSIRDNGQRTVFFTTAATANFVRASFAHVDTTETVTEADRADVLAALSLWSLADGANIANVESTTSVSNHETGELLMNQRQLYEVTSNIGAGEVIAPGTNVSATTVAAQLSAEAAARNTAVAAEASARAANTPADWLYKEIFGNTADWTVDRNGGGTLTKTGRVLTIGSSSTSGTTWSWTNLTGSTHRAFGGDGDSAPANTMVDADYVAISSVLPETSNFSSEYMNKAVILNMYFNTISVVSSTAIRVYARLRRYDETAGEYVYSDVYYCRNVAVTSAGGSQATYVSLAVSPGNQKTDLNENIANYTEIAIYFVTRSRTISGTVLIDPAVTYIPKAATT